MLHVEVVLELGYLVLIILNLFQIHLGLLSENLSFVWKSGWDFDNNPATVYTYKVYVVTNGLESKKSQQFQPDFQTKFRFSLSKPR